MRSKNAVKNLLFYLGYEVIVFVFGLIFPRYIILQYGSEINGLTATITRILALINLIQAGAVGAAIFQMYRPVAENDYETQSAIIYSSQRYYKKITVIYLALATVCGIFYGFKLESTALSFWCIFLSFAILALNGAGTLLFKATCDIYLSPHQKKYYLMIGQIADIVVRYAYLTLALILKLHFIHIYIAYLAGGIVGVLFNLYYYKKFSKGKITTNPVEKNYTISGKTYLMLQSVGGEAVTASPSIIITTFISLVQSSVFSVYSMVFTSMKTILNSLQLSFSAIFGNLVKTSDDDHIYAVYDVIELATMMLGALLSACVGFLFAPFVEIYTAGVTDAEYLSLILIIFVVCYTALFTFRTSFGYVATVYGLFKYTCWITLIFGGIGIVISTVCVIAFGMPYVMCGLLFNQLGCSIATLVTLKKKVKWFKTRKLYRRSIVLSAMSAGGLILYFLIRPQIVTFGRWILLGCVSAVACFAVLMMYCFVFERSQIKSLLRYVNSIIRKS